MIGSLEVKSYKIKQKLVTKKIIKYVINNKFHSI
jgi:hypothetical protein